MPEWTHTDDKLTTRLEFADFRQAFLFMTEVAFHAEALGHHPDWSNVYNKLEINLSTHDAGNRVTDKDRELARRIDQVAEKYF